MNNKNETKDEQINIRTTLSIQQQVQKDMEQFGGNVSQSQYGELALKYFGKVLREKGALAMLSEIL